MSGRRHAVAIYACLRWICAEMLRPEGVTTPLPPEAPRLAA